MATRLSPAAFILAAVTLAALGTATPAWSETRPITMAEAKAAMLHEHGGGRFWMVAAERLERTITSGDQSVWDMSAWYGGDIHRLRIKSEGEYVDGRIEPWRCGSCCTPAPQPRSGTCTWACASP